MQSNALSPIQSQPSWRKSSKLQLDPIGQSNPDFLDGSKFYETFTYKDQFSKSRVSMAELKKISLQVNQSSQRKSPGSAGTAGTAGTPTQLLLSFARLSMPAPLPSLPSLQSTYNTHDKE